MPLALAHEGRPAWPPMGAGLAHEGRHAVRVFVWPMKGALSRCSRHGIACPSPCIHGGASLASTTRESHLPPPHTVLLSASHQECCPEELAGCGPLQVPWHRACVPCLLLPWLGAPPSFPVPHPLSLSHPRPIPVPSLSHPHPHLLVPSLSQAGPHGPCIPHHGGAGGHDE